MDNDNKTICPNCKAEFLDVYDAAEHWDDCGVNCGTCVDAKEACIADQCLGCKNYTNWRGIGKARSKARQLKWSDMRFMGVLCAILGLIAGFLFHKLIEDFNNFTEYSRFDLNRDGLVNSTDSRICYDIFTGFRVATPAMLERADVDGSGIIDDLDTTLIMDALLGKVEE